MATTEPGHERSAIVLYASETGTSQDLAEELGRLLERLHFSTIISEANAITVPDLATHTIAVFVISTTGQGEFPSNARRFWSSLLRRKLTSSLLDGVSYALVGLGDSSYPRFNFAARKLDKRLKQLGAQDFVEACEADEQRDEGTDGAFLAWARTFRSTLLSEFPLPRGIEPIPDEVQLPSNWHLTSLRVTETANGDVVQQTHTNGVVSPDHDDRDNYEAFQVTLTANTRLTPVSHWQDVRLLTMETAELIDYYPGDVLAVFPKNSAIAVQVLVDRMGWAHIVDMPIMLEATRPVTDVDRYPKPPISLHRTSTYTLRQLLTGYLDINAIPRRSFFTLIANYTDNELHKERLVEFTKPEYLDEYYDYATRPRRSIIEILQEFDSVDIPWQEAINVFPILRPRQFSIASGGELKTGPRGTKIELLVAIVKYRTVIRRVREGVCTRYLASLAAGSTLRVVHKCEGRFHKQEREILRDHILIGPGTGVAPLRALIHEKAQLAHGKNVNQQTLLFFGGRNAEADAFFADEWPPLASSDHSEMQVGLQVIAAFSRDQRTKVYVQDRIREKKLAVAHLLREKNATVIVCGSSGAMPKAVREALVDCLAVQLNHTHAALSREEAEVYLAAMEKHDRYQQETW